MCECKSTKSGGPAVLVVGGVAATAFAVRVMLDVFSWHGLAYSFGLASGEGLFCPPAVRAVTLLGLLELGALVVLALDDHDYLTRRGAWAMAHVHLVQRVVVGAALLAALAYERLSTYRPDALELPAVAAVVQLEAATPPPLSIETPERSRYVAS